MLISYSKIFTKYIQMLMSSPAGNIFKQCSRQFLCLVFVKAQLKAQSIMNFIPVTRYKILIFFAKQKAQTLFEAHSYSKL